MLRFEVRSYQTCKKNRWRTISYATFRGPPCHSRHVRNTDGEPFLMLRFGVRPCHQTCKKYRGRTIPYDTFLGPPFHKTCQKYRGRTFSQPFHQTCQKYRGLTISYATFLGPPFIRYIRNTEGGPSLMLRFEVRLVILDMLEIQRVDHFLCYVSGSALHQTCQKYRGLTISYAYHVIFEK